MAHSEIMTSSVPNAAVAELKAAVLKMQTKSKWIAKCVPRRYSIKIWYHSRTRRKCMQTGALAGNQKFLFFGQILCATQSRCEIVTRDNRASHLLPHSGTQLKFLSRLPPRFFSAHMLLTRMPCLKFKLQFRATANYASSVCPKV